MQPSVFVSYRHADTGGHAGRLFDRLSRWFDAGEVFFDVDTFDAGDVFPERIERAIRAAKIVLVVIGPGWLEELNTRAAGKQTDYVRQEVAAAIQRQAAGEEVLVLPVLMGGAGMPSREALHSDLRGEIGRLSGYQAHTFQGNQADWDHQFVQLREAIARVGGVPKPRFRSPSEVEQPCHVLDDLLSFHFQDPENRLQELYESLEARSSVAAVARSALHGMGGVGKTQLALKYTLDYRDRYVGVWWFRAESEGALQADAWKLCEHAKVLVPDGERPSHALKRWLEREEGRWLLVFDNAAEPDALRPNLPQAGNHHLIVTSRNPVGGGIAAPVELDIWTTEQGVRFLAGRLSGGEREESAALVRDLGGLPLALEQAASYLEATGVTAGVYRRLLDGVNTEGEILDETEGSSAAGYGRSVAKTLSVAFEKLSPPARRLLRLCAFAAPEPVPEWLFREAGDLFSDSLADTVGDDVAWNRIVAELRRYGLASRISDEETGHALVLHRLTQQVVRTRLAKPAEDCGVLQAMLASACTGDPGHPDHWPRYAALAEHVVQLDRFSSHGSLDPGKIVGLLNQVALYLRSCSARYTDAVRLLRRAIDIANRQWGDSHPDTLARMNDLASTLRARGDRGDLGEARELQERVLETQRRVLGESRPETLTSMNNLASTLRALGDLVTVRKIEEQVLEGRRRVLGESHPDTLKSTGNLASTLRAQGELVAARELHEQVSKLLRQVLGEEHPDTLTSMSDLALTLRAQGELGGARELLEQVLETRRRVLGEEHPGTLMSMNDLASTLRPLGDLRGALELQEQVLEGRRRVSGEAHPDTLTSMNNLAVTLHTQGDLGGARKLLGQVLEGRRRVLGEAHPDTLASLRNLAMVLKAQGDHHGVQELGELRRRALGEPPDLEFRSIRLENWMNFAHAEVAIQDRIFLVGPNASGKSNFLDAFRFLKDLASSGGGLQEAIRKRGGMDTLRSLAAPWTPTVTIRVELEEAGEETDQGRRWEYELAFKQGSHGQPFIEKERVRRNGEWLLDRPNQDDRDDSARLVQTSIEQVNANREFRELAECFGSIRYLHIVPQIVREPGRSSGRVGDPFGGDFPDRMERTSAQARAARLRRIGEALRIAVPQLREIEITRDADGHPHLRGRSRHWSPQGAWQTQERFSDGTLRLIGLLWAAMEEGGPLLLEEPELSLHEEIVRVLPQVLIRIQHETRRQIFLSTHSSDLLGDEGIGLDEVLLLVPGDGGTDITSANSHQDIRDLLEGGIPLGDIVIPWTQPEGTYRLALLGDT